MDCTTCGNPISPERLEAIPSTTKCINCARKTDRRPIGFMIPTASKGTASVLVQINPDDPEQVRLARRAHLRSR